LVPAQSCFDKEKLGDRSKRCELIVTLAVRKRFADFINRNDIAPFQRETNSQQGTADNPDDF